MPRQPAVVHKTKKIQTINVVTSADQNYLPGLIALINSTIVRVSTRLFRRQIGMN
jgi:hypothetical protein